MGIGGFITLGVIVVVFGYAITLYNNLVTLKNNVKQAWSNIDVLLKQRHDELPKLVETCKQYMQYEQETLEKVMQARSSVFRAREQGDVQALGQAEGQLRSLMGNLYAVAEQYPELRSNEHFKQLTGRITGLENAIADRREYYNEAVNLKNIRIAQFPDVLIAKMFSFRESPLLRFSTAEKRDVDMKALFG